MSSTLDSLLGMASEYVAETRRLNSLSNTTEETFYPAIRDLLSGILRTHALPFEVRTGTSEEREGGTDRPDFVLTDAALFVGVFGEVKKSDVSIGEIADSTDRDNQIGRYLARTGVVLVSNVRGFGLLTCAPSFDRSLGTPVPPEERDLIGEVDLWAQATGKGTRTRVDAQAVEELAALVTRSVTDFAAIADPADLAKVLARQARDAKESLPGDLRAVAPLLDDYRQALGLSFDIDDAKGDRFFRSSLIQTALYRPRSTASSPPGCSGTEVMTRRLLIWRRRRTICESRFWSNSSTTSAILITCGSWIWRVISTGRFPRCNVSTARIFAAG